MNSIEENSKYLKLPYIRESYKTEITRNEINETDLTSFVSGLLEKEVCNRRERSIQSAKLP